MGTIIGDSMIVQQDWEFSQIFSTMNSNTKNGRRIMAKIVVRDGKEYFLKMMLQKQK